MASADNIEQSDSMNTSRTESIKIKIEGELDTIPSLLSSTDETEPTTSKKLSRTASVKRHQSKLEAGTADLLSLSTSEHSEARDVSLTKQISGASNITRRHSNIASLMEMIIFNDVDEISTFKKIEENFHGYISTDERLAFFTTLDGEWNLFMAAVVSNRVTLVANMVNILASSDDRSKLLNYAMIDDSSSRNSIDADMDFA